MKRMSEDVAGFLSPSTVEIIVCVSAFAYLIKKRKKMGKDTEKDRSDRRWTDSGRAEMED